MSELMRGALAMGFFVAAVFFLRFWKQTRDRLFGLFAIAFLAMSISRVLIGLQPSFGPNHDNLYLLRLLAFGLVLVAILDKNRSKNSH
jgi:hypothetical protein